MSKESRKFGERMRELRLEKGMTQLGLAQEAGLDLTTINELESGNREPMLGTIRKLEKVLGAQLL